VRLFCAADEPDPKSVITFNVELPRFAGRLGISLSNATEPPGTVVIAALTADGLAEKYTILFIIISRVLQLL